MEFKGNNLKFPINVKQVLLVQASPLSSPSVCFKMHFSILVKVSL